MWGSALLPGQRSPLRVADRPVLVGVDTVKVGKRTRPEFFLGHLAVLVLVHLPEKLGRGRCLGCRRSGLEFGEAQLAVLVAVAPASALPTETQDSSTELITTRLTFDGTDGSFYNSTLVGPAGAELGTVARNFTLGTGYWGPNATLSRLRVGYPGNLTLGSNNSTNEVFFARGWVRRIGTTRAVVLTPAGEQGWRELGLS